MMRTFFTPESDHSDRSVRLWEVETGKLVRYFEPPAVFVQRLRFSPDGRSLLGEEGRGKIWWSIPTGRVLRRFVSGAGPRRAYGPVEFSPDGRLLAVSGDYHELLFLDAVNGRELRRWPDEMDDISDLEFNPDGKTLIVGGSCLRFRDTVTGKERYPFLGHRRGVQDLTFTPDGGFVVSVSYGGGLPAWTTDGSPLPPLNGQLTVVGLGYLVESKELIAIEIDGKVRVHQFPSGQETRRFRVQPPSAEAVYTFLQFGHRQYLPSPIYVFGPGGRTLATIGQDGKLELYDVVAGRRVARCDALHTEKTRPVFTATGRSLITVDKGGSLHLWNTTTGRNWPSNRAVAIDRRRSR